MSLSRQSPKVSLQSNNVAVSFRFYYLEISTLRHLKFLVVENDENDRQRTLLQIFGTNFKGAKSKNIVQDEAARPPMLIEAVQDEAANAGQGRPG